LGLSAKAQALTVRLRVVSLSPAIIRMDGDLRQPSDTWSFLNTYGRVIGLGERIENFSVTDALGNSVAVRRISPADFKSEKPVSHFSYQVRVSEPSNSADEAHVSWLNEQGGFLMLADLLPSMVNEPQRSVGVQIALRLPDYWNIATSAQANREGLYEVPDPIPAVFFVGKDLRVKHKQIRGVEFLFTSAGEWPFPNDSVTDTAARIIRDHARHVGFELHGRVMLMLAPFPGTVGADRWTAETRGSNVVLLLGRKSPPDVLLGRLSVVLTHELFHLWVPGALLLAGDYDWFYEGFTLYQALRAAVRLGFIDFQEYLSTMARVYDSYLATTDRDRLSLIEASQRRWTNSSSLVYDKGMLVAFLFDLGLRNASRNMRSLDDV
jgi:predicted metalloprotease with PDZ domain